MLASRGFSIVLVRTCRAALELQQEFDFAILDLDLPDGNGVDLAGALFEKGVMPSVAFFTSSIDSELLARAHRIGTVVKKSHGAGELLPFIPTDVAGPPQSQTTSRGRSQRASSSSSLRRVRAR